MPFHWCLVVAVWFCWAQLAAFCCFFVSSTSTTWELHWWALTVQNVGWQQGNSCNTLNEARQIPTSNLPEKPCEEVESDFWNYCFFFFGLRNELCETKQGDIIDVIFDFDIISIDLCDISVWAVHWRDVDFCCASNRYRAVQGSSCLLWVLPGPGGPWHLANCKRCKKWILPPSAAGYNTRSTMCCVFPNSLVNRPNN